MIKEILIKLGIDVTGAKGGLNEAGKQVDDFAQKTDNAKKSTKGLGDTLDNLPGSAGQAAQGVKGLIGQFKVLMATPIGIVITAVVAAVGALVAIFKDFAPITDFISDKLAYLTGAFRGLQTAMYNLVETGTFTTESITEQAQAMERAAQMTRTYEDNLDSLNLRQAQYEAQIDKLLKQAKNKSISDAQANEYIKEATRLQQLQIKELKEFSKLETSMLIEKVKAHGGTYKQILAIQKGASIESLGNLSNELDAALSELQKNYTKRVQEVGSLESRTEKIKNVSDALEEKREAKRQKAAEDRKKREEAEFKDREERAKLEEERLKKQAEDEKYFADFIAEIDKNTAEGKKQWALKDIEIQKQKADAEIALIDAVSSASSAASDLLGRDTAAGKALAVASATISTYQAIAKNLAAFAGVPIPGYAIAQSIATGLAGLAAVKNILSVKVPNQSGGDSPVPSLSIPQTRPSSGFTRLGNENPIRTTSEGELMKVYVTESDITNTQNKVNAIKAKATIG